MKSRDDPLEKSAEAAIDRAISRTVRDAPNAESVEGRLESARINEKVPIRAFGRPPALNGDPAAPTYQQLEEKLRMTSRKKFQRPGSAVFYGPRPGSETNTKILHKNIRIWSSRPLATSRI